MSKFRASFVGWSEDLKTNVWSITCLNCGHQHTPPTTMLASQLVECPKCQEKEVINYNNL